MVAVPPGQFAAVPGAEEDGVAVLEEAGAEGLGDYAGAEDADVHGPKLRRPRPHVTAAVHLLPGPVLGALADFLIVA